MSSQSSLLTVIVDNKIMEEAKHNLSSALAEDARRESPLEEAGFRELEILQRKLNPALTQQEQRCPKSRAATFN